MIPKSGHRFSEKIMLHELTDHVVQQPEETRTLDRACELALLLGRDRGDAARHDLAALRNVALQQVGTDVSAIFAPAFWGVPGRSVPVFNVTGNHGFTNGNFQVVNWPEANAA